MYILETLENIEITFKKNPDSSTTQIYTYLLCIPPLPFIFFKYASFQSFFP